MTVLFLIVARGGSKRVPGKNLREIHGVSLVGYKCLAATHAQSCSLCIISTDSPPIADVARQYGVVVPFIRPAELATDTATTEDVVRHAMAWAEDGERVYDAIMLLEPSSPFVRPSDYDAAVELMIATEVPFVFGEVLYLFRWDYLKTRVDLYDQLERMAYYPMPAGQAIDIDTLQDLRQAERLAEKGLVDLSWAPL